MPTIANITVKKNDGATDIIYTGQAGSGGDKIPAVWRAPVVANGTAPAHAPEFRLMAQSNAAKTARRLIGILSYPSISLDSATSIASVKSRALVEINGVFPVDMPQASIDEAVSQGVNLFVSTLVKDSMKQGFAPR